MKRLLPLLALLISVDSLAAIALEGCGAEAVSSGATSLEVSPHDTPTDGELIVITATAVTDADVDVRVNETGWTEAGETYGSGGLDRNVHVSYKIASSETGGAYTVDTVEGGSYGWAAIACTYSGIDEASPEDATATTVANQADTANPDPASITTNTDGAWVLSTVGAADCADGTAPTPPSGYTLAGYSDAAPNYYSIQGYKEVATAGAEDPGTWTLSTANCDSSLITWAISPAAAGPSFTAGPTEAPATNGFTIGGTLTGAGTLTAYAVGVNPGDGAPSCAQIKSGNNDGDAAADLSANEVWTADAADTFLLTKAGAWPRYDVHVCASDGAADTAVTSLTDQDRSADASQTIVISTSVSTTSPFALQSENTCDTTDTSDTLTGCADTSWLQAGMLVDLSAGFADLTDVIVLAVTSSTIQLENAANATTANITVTQDQYYSPTVAAGDVLEGADANSETDAVTVGVDLEISWTDTCGGCYTTWDYNIQDVSDTSDGDLDTGPPAWTTGDDTMHFFSTVPVFDQNLELSPIVLDYNTAMSTIEMDSFCIDPDGQALVIAVRSGTLPTGVSLSSNDLTGTPTVEDEAGAVMNFTCADSGGLYDAVDTSIYVINTITMPTIDDSDLDAALDDVQAAFPWRERGGGITSTYACSDEVSEQVISQSPAATTEVTHDQAISLVVSVGAAPCSRRYQK